jgi:glycosyltransferase involved in cell wall biosynthesis
MIEGRTVAVIVPAYRAEAQISGVLSRIPGFVDRVFVVDDASPDGTGVAAESVRDQRIRLIRHDANLGVGGAMATGFRAALQEGADIIVKCDADGQMNPQDIGALIRPLLDGAAEYSKGCRFHHSSELKTMPTVRRAGNFGLTFLMKLASGYWHVLDPQNGFVAIRREALSGLRIDKLARGYFFENDMLIRLNALQARVADVPLPSRYGDESSSLKPGRALVEFPIRLIAGFWRRVLWRYVFYDVSPVAVFLLFGSALFLFGAIFGAYHWIWGAIHHQPTQTGTVIVAAVPFILGFQLLLQALVLDVENSPRADIRPGITAQALSQSAGQLTAGH